MHEGFIPSKRPSRETLTRNKDDDAKQAAISMVNVQCHLKDEAIYEISKRLLPLEQLREEHLVMSKEESQVICSFTVTLQKPRVCLKTERLNSIRRGRAVSELRTEQIFTTRLAGRKHDFCSRRTVIETEQNGIENAEGDQKKTEVLAALWAKQVTTGYILLAVSAWLLIEHKPAELFEHSLRWWWNPGIGDLHHPNSAC